MQKFSNKISNKIVTENTSTLVLPQSNIIFNRIFLEQKIVLRLDKKKHQRHFVMTSKLLLKNKTAPRLQRFKIYPKMATMNV